MRFQSIILILFILFSSLATNQALGISTRVNINDPHVIDTGNFKVINGVIDIMNNETKYRLTLSANNGSTSNNYGAIVLEKPLEHLRNLTAFLHLFLMFKLSNVVFYIII
ncbi:transmembrane protein, putative [Medicago truncatula]|uniref:Transmembrane protein, putative n=1 Tax=Medicago truncatula TaxID=3880 RepID=G7KD64_MEDTR|nr:transmembrane protein, putative [Medicago truncatula]